MTRLFKSRYFWLGFADGLAFALPFVVLLILAMMTIAANAQTQCAPKAAMEMQVMARFGETLFGQGISAGNVIKWFVNPQTRSWTQLAINPQGLACIISAGDNFETSGHGAPKPGSNT